MAALVAIVSTGCVIHIREDRHHHPDRCYDCHSSWELDRLSADVQCIEFEITIVSDGYWYKPVGADDSQRKFHLLKAGGTGTIVGPAEPAGL
jgi:hypothetical protein